MAILAVVLVACGGSDEAAPTRSTTTAAAPASLPGSDDFCSLLAEVDPAQLVSGESSDPADVRRSMRSLVEVVQRAHRLAPAEIHGDLALVRAGLEALDAALAAEGYDFERLAESGRASLVTEALRDPEFAAAGDRLGDYRREGCGL